jgi:hypothetical protein
MVGIADPTPLLLLLSPPPPPPPFVFVAVVVVVVVRWRSKNPVRRSAVDKCEGVRM